MRWLAALALLVFALPAAAQLQRGEIDGVVVDAAQHGVRGVTVVARDVRTNTARSVITGAAGEFRLAAMPPADYEVSVREASGATAEPVTVRVGETVHVTLVMRTAGVSETIDVQSTSAPRANEPVVAAVVDKERIEELPVQTRRYLDFVRLTPEIAPARGRAPRTKGSGFSFAGQRPESNVMTIDGLGNNDEYSGATRSELSLESIQEFDVVTHGWSAESGGGGGASVNVVTKSGANTPHGDAFVFGRDGSLDARSFGGDETSDRFRAGGAIGGTLRKDVAFYYVAAERERARRHTATRIDDAALPLLNESLADSPLVNAPLRISMDRFPSQRDETELSAKLTLENGSGNSLTFRTTRNDDRDSAGDPDVVEPFDPTGVSDSSTRDAAHAANWFSILGAHATNEVRGQLSSRELRQQGRLGESDSTFVVAGVAAFGSALQPLDDVRQRYAELSDSFGFAVGRHFLRAGAGVERVELRVRDREAVIYEFPTIESFVERRPSQVRQEFGAGAARFDSVRADAFLQDEWSVGTLSVDAGVRFDAQSFPSRLRADSRRFEPRLGFAWTAAPAWTIRGGAGVFADRVPLEAISRAMLADGTHGFEQIIDSRAADVLGLTSGAPLDEPFAGVAPSIYVVRRGPLDPVVRQFHVGIDHVLTSTFSASASYTRTAGDHLLRTVNTNLAPAAGALLRVDPRFTDVFELQPTARSRYDGVILSATQHMSEDGEWSVAYTWSRADDDASSWDEQPADPFALRAEWAPSRYDQRHRLVASGLFEIGEEEGDPAPRWLRHIEVAPIVEIASGTPYTLLGTTDDRRAHAPANRAAGERRNARRLPATASVDLRLVKYIPMRGGARFDFVVEAFNLTNRKNVVAVQEVHTESAGAPTVYASARQVEFSLDYEF